MTEAVLERIRAYIDRHRAHLHTPGLAVAITDRVRCSGVLTDGLANLDAGAPVRPEHRFQIGSISKGCTAVAVLQLREDGRLDLDAPLTEYLPWFQPGTAFKPITLHHLLSHTSGLITGMDFTGEATHELWALRHSATGRPPGERLRYSDLGYKALGLVIEAVTGRPWWERVRERVLEPIGMGDADPIITTEIRERLATGYAPRFDDRPWLPRHGWVPAMWFESATADGTICASAEELTAYCRFLLNGGEGPHGPVLSPDGFALMTRPVVEDPDAPGHVFGYGVKWIEEGGERRVLGHSGSMVGFSSYALVDVEAGFGVTVLANSSNSERLELARFALACLAAGARGELLPDVPEPEDPLRVPDAADFAGVYREVGSDAPFSVDAQGGRLFLGAGQRVSLVPLGGDRFAVDDPELDRFAVRFLRDASGTVTTVHHGSDRFENGRHAGSVVSATPEGWSAFVGHYRCWDPWGSNFRVFLRAGDLWMEAPDDTFDNEPDRQLHPLPDGSFRVGKASSPDRIAFEAVIEGRATRATYDCSPFYRTFTA